MDSFVYFAIAWLLQNFAKLVKLNEEYCLPLLATCLPSVG